MIKENKRLLRKKYKVIRDLVADKKKLSDDISLLALGSEFYKNAETVLVYSSSASEADTTMIINKALADNKRVALPKCSDKNGNMKFYYIESLWDLAEGMYEISEPVTDKEASSFGENSLCFVPGLSFDREGFRLGYGKGYYDRFLMNFPGKTAGLCYEECLADFLPRDEFDIKVDFIITNTKIYDLR